MGRTLNTSDRRPGGALPFVVRPAAAGDEEAISAVCAAGFAASSAGLLPSEEIRHRVSRYYDVARVRTELLPSSSGWLGYAVAEVGDRVVGAAGGSAHAGVGHLLVLYLHLDLRGRGIGSALLDHVTAQHRATGATRQRVSVTDGNEMGLPFYRARGFVQVGREPFTGADGGVYSLVLERRLD